MYSRNQTRIDYSLCLIFRSFLCPYQSYSFWKSSIFELFLQKFDRKNFLNGFVELFILTTFVSSDKIDLPFRKLNFVFIPEFLKILNQTMRVNLIYFFQLHIGIFESFSVDWERAFRCKGNAGHCENFFAQLKFVESWFERLFLDEGQGWRSSWNKVISKVKMISQPCKDLEPIFLTHFFE